MTDKDGKSPMETESKPICRKDITLEGEIPDLLISSTIPLEWMNEEPFVRYGRDTSTNIRDSWDWDIDEIRNNNNLEEVTYMLAMISSYWLRRYEDWYYQKEYEFKKYRYEHGDDPYTFKGETSRNPLSL